MSSSSFILKTLLLLSLLLRNVVHADDWNAGTGGKPSRNGLSSERGPLTPTLLWQGGLPAVIAQPPVIEGDVLAMSRIQNVGDVLHGTLIVAHNLTTGDTLWTKDLPVDFPTTDWRNRVTAIRDGRVYATRSGNDNYSFIYALSATTGAILWRSQDSVSENSTESPSFAPNGDLIVGSFRNVERINATNGQRVWRNSRVSPTSNGSEAAVFGNRVYLWEASPQGPKPSVFDLTTGEYQYSGEGIGGGFVQQLGLFVGPTGTVYAPRTQNNAVSDFLVALTDILDLGLIEKWRVPLGYVPFASFGVGPDGSVYSYTREKRVVRINPQTGSIIDSSEIMVADFFQPRMAVDSTGIIYVTNGGFSQGVLYSLNPNLTTRWSTPIASVNIGGPAIGRNGTMVVCGVGTDVRAYRGAPTGVEEGGRTTAGAPMLDQNYPNPFNPSTRIRFQISSPGFVTIKLYDVLGREVSTLVNEDFAAGRYERTFDATGLGTGVYLYRLTVGGLQQTRRLIVVR
jgi:outer membrane protein assembly factor BamB